MGPHERQPDSADPSWDVWTDIPPRPIYTFNKGYPFLGDNIDVLVFVRLVGERFEVSMSAEARVSGPYDTLRGVFDDLDSAMREVRVAQAEWDARHPDAD